VEQFIRGREFCIGLLGNNPVETFPILEIDLEGDHDAIQTLDNKKESPRRKICPAQIPHELAEKMRKLSVQAFQSLHLRDFARVDIREDENNNIYILEINSMASLGETGSYLTAAKVAGYDFVGLVNKILDVSAVRYFADTSLPFKSTDKKTKMPLSVKLRGYLRSRQENIESLLEKMVNINSHVRNVMGVNDLGKVIRRELSQLGFTQEVFSQLEVGNQLFFNNSFDDGYDILLIGNLDNDIRISKHEYFRLEEQKLHGTGIWEHKGGIAVAISALQALRFARQLKRVKIGFLLTTDDSLQGKFAKSLFVDKSRKSTMVFGLHGADLTGSIITSRSGSAVYRFSQKLIRQENPEDIPLASSIFSKLIASWCDLSINDKDLVISPADTNFNSVIREPYAYGEATISVRFNRIEDFENAEIKMNKLIPKRKHKDFLHFQIEGGLRRPPLVETDSIKSLWYKIKKTAAKLDISVTKEHRWSSSDICFVDKDKPVADGFGPVGMKPKEGSEFILRHSLIDRALLLAILISELGASQ
jgi:D-alanine-D-alanine ligase